MDAKYSSCFYKIFQKFHYRIKYELFCKAVGQKKTQSSMIAKVFSKEIEESEGRFHIRLKREIVDEEKKVEG